AAIGNHLWNPSAPRPFFPPEVAGQSVTENAHRSFDWPRSNEMSAKKVLMRSAAVSLGVFALTGTSAFAADMVREQPPAPPVAPVEAAPVPTWEGPYAGVSLGYGFNGETSADLPGVSIDVDNDGFIGGGFVGWQGQSGQFVYVVEADFNDNGVVGRDAGLDVDHSVDGSLRARLGFAATDNILIYGTGGGAVETLEVTDTLAGVSDDNTMLGWT